VPAAVLEPSQATPQPLASQEAGINRLPLQCSRFRDVGGFALKQRGRSRGFTLVEMLVSIAVLAVLVFLVTRLMNSATTITTLGNKRMDTDSQARQLLDRMAVDFDQMVKRSDVSYWVKTGANTEPGNDQLAFFSAIPGYLDPNQQAYPSNIAVTAYRVNAVSTSTSYNRVERMGKGLNLNGAYAGSITPLLFLDSASSPSTTILNIWPTATNASATDSDYEVIGPQVFRFEYYYLLTTGALSAGPWANPSVPAIKDVAAIVVDIAAIDPKSKVLLTDAQTQITTLITRLPDYAETMGPGQLLAAWQTVLDGIADMPRPAIQGVRLYERYFYLNQ
jgi:prepilin-type N-terminal cleavage/methylation domain-containing protein